MIVCVENNSCSSVEIMLALQSAPERISLPIDDGQGLGSFRFAVVYVLAGLVLL